MPQITVNVPAGAAGPLLAVLAQLQQGLRTQVAQEALTSIRLAELLPEQLRTTPLFRAEETPRNLCAGRPPFGLLGDASQLGPGGANVSRLRGIEKQRAHLALCERFAEDLLRRRKGSHGMPPRLFPPNASCAVVGSGGRLARSRSGAEIDAHDVIMRFNAAPAGGEWAADVGSRTTLRIFTDKTYQKATAINGEQRGEQRGKKRGGKAGGEASGKAGRAGRALSDGAPRRRTASVVYCMAQGWVGKCMHSSLWQVNPAFVRHLRAHLDAHQGRGRLPSAGLLGMAAALTRCSRVSLYGFGNASDASGESSSACGHYWECSRQQDKYFGGKAGYHDWQAQWRVVSDWIGRAARLGRASHDLAFHPGASPEVGAVAGRRLTLSVAF